MTWLQIYNPLGNLALSAIVAAIPLVVLFYMLAIRRSPGHYAAFFGTASAVILAILVWGMPTGLALDATIMGAAFGLFPIVWIILTTIWVYNMTVESGEFDIIRNSLACITDDRRLQALFIAFAFGSFIEGTAGSAPPSPSPRPCWWGSGSTPDTPQASVSSPTPPPSLSERSASPLLSRQTSQSSTS